MPAVATPLLRERYSILTTAHEWREAHPVLLELKPGLSLDGLLGRREALQADGYTLIGVVDSGNRVVSVAGVQVLPDLHYGRALRIHDFVTLNSERSRGLGRDLLRAVEYHAEQLDVPRVVLYSKLERDRAHAFYELKGGYPRFGHVYIPAADPIHSSVSVSEVGTAEAGYSLVVLLNGNRLLGTASVVRAPSLTRGFDLRADRLSLEHAGDTPGLWLDSLAALDRYARDQGAARCVITLSTGDAHLGDKIVDWGGYLRYGVEFRKNLPGLLS